MGRKKCGLEKEFSEQLKLDRLSDEMKEHMAHCRVCSDEYTVHSWIMTYSGPESAGSVSVIPPFDKLWTQAFSAKRIEPDLIEQAMRPMKITGLFGMVTAFLITIIFLIFNWSTISRLGIQLDSIRQFGRSFITPFIKMFNSSVYVSVPLTIVFVSVFLYLLFSIVNSINKRTFGRV